MVDDCTVSQAFLDSFGVKFMPNSQKSSSKIYGFCPWRGMGYEVIFPANQLGGLKNVWDLREYVLCEPWVTRESTVVSSPLEILNSIHHCIWAMCRILESCSSLIGVVLVMAKSYAVVRYQRSTPRDYEYQWVNPWSPNEYIACHPYSKKNSH